MNEDNAAWASKACDGDRLGADVPSLDDPSP